VISSPLILINTSFGRFNHIAIVDRLVFNSEASFDLVFDFPSTNENSSNVIIILNP
jgi:hypothetical protein